MAKLSTHTRREALALGTGALVALGGAGLRGRFAAPHAGRPALWAADRAGHAVFGLDGDGLVCRRMVVTAPVAILGMGRWGGPVVLSAASGLRDGPYERVDFGADGRLRALVRCPAPAPWPRRLAAFGPRPVRAVAVPRVANGRWLLRDMGDGGGQGDARLERWARPSAGAPWRLAFCFVLPFGARALAEVEGGVWVAGDRRAEALFYSSTGDLSLRRRLADAVGVEAIEPASRASGGGVWLAAAGALLRLDGKGRRLPGQGGFAHLVDLSSAPADFRSR